MLEKLDLSSFVKAHKSLGKAVLRSSKNPNDEEIRDAVIQRFKYTYELSWKMITGILAVHVPYCEVRAFGSRVNGKAKKFSDLDIVIIPDNPVSVVKMASLRDAFSESICLSELISSTGVASAMNLEKSFP